MTFVEPNSQDLPKHVAIIMDGNGRWAEKRGKPRVFGHVRGSTRVRELIREAHRIGLKALTLYAFSTENWGRPEHEVKVLMKLLPKWIMRERNDMMKNNIRFRVVGNIDRMPAGVATILKDTIKMSEGNTGMNFTLALSYGSRDEITSAVKRIVARVQNGELQVGQISEETISNELFHPDIGDPDLLIRTSGEVRISNFLLWQLAYTEFYFTDVAWPDFDRNELHKAFQSYIQRDRRYGLTQAQIQATDKKNEKTVFLQ